MTENDIQKLVREAKCAYAREWRRKNPDKVRENNRRYWERKALANSNPANEAK